MFFCNTNILYLFVLFQDKKHAKDKEKEAAEKVIICILNIRQVGLKPRGTCLVIYILSKYAAQVLICNQGLVFRAKELTE